MKMKEIIDFFASWKTTVLLFIAYSTALAVATLIESYLGSEAARSIIYTSWWIYVIYAMLILNFFFVAGKMALRRRRMWGVIALHLGFVIIIAGAFITHLWGFEGIMHIREGETSDMIIEKDGQHRRVPFSVGLNDFSIVRYHGSNSPSSFESDVTINHLSQLKTQKIFMNNIARVAGYRIYQSSYDKDEMGTILTVNFDPVGTYVSYIGYFVLIVAMAVALCGRKSRLRTLYASLGEEA